MTKETLLMLCTSLCLTLTIPSVARAGLSSQAPDKEIRTATQRTAPVAISKSGNPLLADDLSIKKKLKDLKKNQAKELEELRRMEDLEAPAGDLYGDDSWSGSVNPFASADRPALPDQFDIDLNDFVMPIEKKNVTSHFGYRARFGRNHYGTDLQLSIGDTVRAAFSGKVRIASYEGRGYGRYLVLRHSNGLETVYGHLSRSLVREGTVVKAGDPIALGGNTGRSTGPHLHFEARFMGIPLNPEHLFDFAIGVPRMDNYTFYRSRDGRSSTRLASAYARPAKKSSDWTSSVYRIKSGDTLSSIARQQGTTVAKICQLNGISRKYKLSAGKTLRLPS